MGYSSRVRVRIIIGFRIRVRVVGKLGPRGVVGGRVRVRVALRARGR